MINIVIAIVFVAAIVLIVGIALVAAIENLTMAVKGLGK